MSSDTHRKRRGKILAAKMKATREHMHALGVTDATAGMNARARLDGFGNDTQYKAYVRGYQSVTKQNPRRQKRATKKAKRASQSWGIFAVRNGKKAPRMFFSGDRFTNNGEPTPFASSDAAATKARALLSTFPKLSGYRVTVEKVKRKRNP